MSLALGIGISTGILSTNDSVLVWPLPFPSPERLLWISEEFRRLKIPSGMVVVSASSGFFPIFGMQPVLGRVYGRNKGGYAMYTLGGFREKHGI